ncbi:sulfotransferase family protein [Salinibacter ruber]|uniref:sulfotransferase family protein n=1 Tax=Salinibacter ruber TaxID=146919 RepID=UPI00216849E9|nr:sulfotransferase [Salinibacter ruber]
MRPVFIVGTARSGTSLLYRTIILHSDFFVGEVCLEETRVFEEATRILPRLQKREKNPLYKYMLRDDEQFRQFVRSLYPVALAQWGPDVLLRKLGWWPYPERVWKAMGGQKVVKEFFRKAKIARGGKRIVEKTPSHLNCVGYIVEAFPKCKIISTARHPIDVYTSYVRRKEKTGEEWLRVSPDDFCEIYKSATKKINYLKKSISNFKVIKYEDITSSPKKTFEKICKYINVKFEKGPIRGKIESLSDWKKDPYLSEPISKATKDWKKYIKEEEKEEIYEKVGSQMKEMGYARKNE